MRTIKAVSIDHLAISGRRGDGECDKMSRWRAGARAGDAMFEARIRNEHTAISIDETRRLVRMRRTSVRADIVAELTAALELLLTGLD